MQIAGSDSNVANKTHKLPIYGDIGGLICIDEYLNLHSYDNETGFTSPLSDYRWCTIALACGAKKYEFLRPMLPQRTDSAITCEHCKGLGYWFRSNIICGKCLGLGWHDGAKE